MATIETDHTRSAREDLFRMRIDDAVQDYLEKTRNLAADCLSVESTEWLEVLAVANDQRNEHRKLLQTQPPRQ